MENTNNTENIYFEFSDTVYDPKRFFKWCIDEAFYELDENKKQTYYTEMKYFFRNIEENNIELKHAHVISNLRHVIEKKIIKKYIFWLGLFYIISFVVFRVV